jgi:hypothetical protein
MAIWVERFDPPEGFREKALWGCPSQAKNMGAGPVGFRAVVFEGEV